MQPAGWSHLVELDPLVGDEDDLVPVGPTETQNVRVLRLQERQKHGLFTRRQQTHLIRPFKNAKTRDFCFLAAVATVTIATLGATKDERHHRILQAAIPKTNNVRGQHARQEKGGETFQSKRLRAYLAFLGELSVRIVGYEVDEVLQETLKPQKKKLKTKAFCFSPPISNWKY